MSNPAEYETEQSGMGTEMVHRAFGSHAQEALRAVADEARRLEIMLSRYRPRSEIGRVNASAGVKCESVSSETSDLLSRALEFSIMSRGLFDPTIGPLVDLWDYKNAHESPSQTRISQVLPLVNHDDLLVDKHRRTAGLNRTGQSIDLGGIAKGFASDRLIEIFKRYKVTSAFTNIGGNVSTLGNRPDGSPWRVGIRHPRQSGSLLGAVAVTSKAVVTSGDYERYFIDREGKRYHHILDPITGYPAESGLISVTVVADSAMEADALSTTLFIAGMERGLKLLRGFDGVEAIFVDTGLCVYATQDLRSYLQTSPGLRVIYI